MKTLEPELSLTRIDGTETTLGEYRGRVVLVVNTASRCGFTKQYAALQELQEAYEKRGFSVLGFPCNQFGGQEPGNAEEIRSFCDTRFGVTFPLFAKVEVNGPGAHPLFARLVAAAPGLLGTRRIKWNFTKFLVDGEGRVRGRWSPFSSPHRLRRRIERLLPPEDAP